MCYPLLVPYALSSHQLLYTKIYDHNSEIKYNCNPPKKHIQKSAT